MYIVTEKRKRINALRQIATFEMLAAFGSALIQYVDNHDVQCISFSISLWLFYSDHFPTQVNASVFGSSKYDFIGALDEALESYNIDDEEEDDDWNAYQSENENDQAVVDANYDNVRVGSMRGLLSQTSLDIAPSSVSGTPRLSGNRRRFSQTSMNVDTDGQRNASQRVRVEESKEEERENSNRLPLQGDGNTSDNDQLRPKAVLLSQCEQMAQQLSSIMETVRTSSAANGDAEETNLPPVDIKKIKPVKSLLVVSNRGVVLILFSKMKN